MVTCSIVECVGKVRARGWCSKHYQRWKKHGDPLFALLDRDRTPEQRFWAFVNKDGPPPIFEPSLGPCWLWTGGLAEGYGVFSLEGRQVKAHILSFTWAKGEIPEGWERDHLCRVRACVNPDHLEAVEHWTNVARGISPHGVNTTKTHCPKNHPYDEANTYLNPSGQRVCKICAKQRTRDWYRRARSAAA